MQAFRELEVEIRHRFQIVVKSLAVEIHLNANEQCAITAHTLCSLVFVTQDPDFECIALRALQYKLYIIRLTEISVGFELLVYTMQYALC